MNSTELARRARLLSLEMLAASGAPHAGSIFSMLDILAVLYTDILKVDSARPLLSTRDRFILSKGHAAAGLYAVLSEKGFFPRAWLESFHQEGSPLTGHVNHAGVPGIELSTGSLGHGVSVGAGLALAGCRTFILVGDGECNEGAIWEAAMFSSHRRLANLTVIVDVNGLQGLGETKDVLDLSHLAAKWKAFGWEVRECNGHDHVQLRAALSAPASDKPRCLLANTIKGKGVSFMENELVWHYRSPSAEEYRLARLELERS